MSASDETASKASTLVTDYLTDYGQSILKDLFPSPIDGLKSVHRRFIYGMRNTSGPIKSSAAIATTKTLHDHGDPSIYESIVRLAVPYHHRPPLIHVHGNAGTYGDPTPAASRYTSIEMLPITHDLFYEGVDTQALPKVPTTDMMGVEPVHLVPALPMALLFASNTIGYGFSSLTPCQNFNDVCDLVTAYAEHFDQNPIKAFPYQKHISKFLPDFPVCNTITNEEELRKAYKNGDFDHRILLEGEVDLYHDRIVVRTLPYGMPVSTVQRIQDRLRHRNSWEEQYIASVDDYSRDATEANITIKLKKNIHVFDAWEHLRTYINVSGSYVPNRNYVLPDGYIDNIPPFDILRRWFQQRCTIIESSKRHTLSRMYKDLWITEAYLIIHGHADRAIEIIKTSESYNDAMENIMAAFTHLTPFQAKYLLNVPISTLTKTSKENLLKQHENQKERIERHIETFAKIPQEIAQRAQTLKKRYGVPRTSRLPRYIGHVHLPAMDGTVQFETMAEIHSLLENFPKGPFNVYTYGGDQEPIVVDPNHNKTRRATSKHYKGLVHWQYRSRDTYTVKIEPSEHTACSVKGVVSTDHDPDTFYVPKTAIGIQRDGVVKKIDVAKDVSLRKSIHRRGSATPFIYFHAPIEQPYYLLVFNDAEPNILTLQRVTPSKSSIILSPEGSLELTHHTTGVDWYVNYRSKFIKRINARLFHITDASQLLKDKVSVRIDLQQQKWRNSRHFHILQ